jgi:hypothetical protein
VNGTLALAWAGFGSRDQSFEGFTELNFAATEGGVAAAIHKMHGFAGSFVFATVPSSRSPC